VGGIAYQSRGPCERVRLSTSCLAVAESRGAKAFYGHLDESLDSGELQNVVLRSSRFKHHVVGEHSGFGVTCTHRAKLEGGRQQMDEYILGVFLSTINSLPPFPSFA